MEKIAIKGDQINGDKIIEYFISLGASNKKWRWNGKSSNGYYFINNELFIDNCNVPPMDYRLYESWDKFWTEYELNLLNKNKMEERNIKISLERAKDWYKQGGDLKEVALQAFSENELKDNFPESWDEFLCSKGNMYALINHLTKDERKAMDALTKLIQLRDEYWKLDNNWQPKYDTPINPQLLDKHIIYTEEGMIRKKGGCIINHILAFRTSELRDKFYENFKDLIEEAKMFL